MKIVFRTFILVAICKWAAPVAFSKSNVVNNINLENYEVVCERVKLKGMHEASGLTYSKKTKSLYIIVDRAPIIYEIKTEHLLDCLGDKNFKITKKYLKERTYGISQEMFNQAKMNIDDIDTEGIAYIGTNGDEDILAVLREAKKTSHNTIMSVKFTKDSGGKKILGDMGSVYEDKDKIEDDGWEGIAYDNINEVFYIADETTRIVSKISGTQLSKATLNIPGATILGDIAGLYHYNTSGTHPGNLLILSEESNHLIEVDLRDNTVISGLSLNKKQDGNNLEKSIPQPEGVTMDDNGYLYIVSERPYKILNQKTSAARSSLIYVFKKK
jgi:uncharacterized protein YjiK